MAYASTGAQWAPDHPEVMQRVESALPSPVQDAAPRSRWHLPRSMPRPVSVLVAALLVSLLLPASLPPAQVDAKGSSATCGTNWNSKKKPPKTIRVLLTNRTHKKVVVVPFREYVAQVMSSGEFPTWLPPAVLQAGAVAVKQYGWYYALKGHHRSTYKTATGICYDVRNDTNDQLYRTTGSAPTAKQQAAVDATWGLTLRKGSNFFLTGYRAGVASKCASDADGWRLYAKSMVDCAKKGWSRQEIQTRYYAPKVSFIWQQTKPPPHGDSTPPTVSVPEVDPTPNQPNVSRVRVSVSWEGTDRESGVAGYRLQERVNGGAWQEVDLASASTTSLVLFTRPGKSYQFRVKSWDKANNKTGWIEGVTFEPKVVQSDGARLRGNWTDRSISTASGDAVISTIENGATATLSFTGSGIGLMAAVGPKMGKATIRIDGTVVDVIDLRRSTPANRRVVWSRNWSKVGTHTIRVEALGTAGRPRIDLDAFVLLH